MSSYFMKLFMLTELFENCNTHYQKQKSQMHNKSDS